jgi:hypothetical protein
MADAGLLAARVIYACPPGTRNVTIELMANGVFNIPPLRESPTYKLFITHAWDHQEYDALVDLITPDATFRWENLSVPKENPITILIGLPKSIRKLVHELDDRIRQANCVLIITGMYVANRQWIQSEIEAALDFKKPVVGVAPRGQERIPDAARIAIEQANGEQVRWNRDSIISAIRRRSGLEPMVPQAEFLRSLAPSQTRPTTLQDLVGRPTYPPPPGASALSDLVWSKYSNALRDHDLL